MPEVLKPAVYSAATLGTVSYSGHGVSPLAEENAHINTAPDDEGTIPRYYFGPRYSTISSYQPSECSPVSYGDFPTPRGGLFKMAKSPSFIRQEVPPDLTDQGGVQDDNDFDSLYDVTDDEAEVPLKCSESVKKVATRNRYPSLIIPSPSAWPTIEKLQSAISGAPPTSAQLLTPSRRALSMITSHNRDVPHSATPSLDGSLTSEEMDRLSCPSTPDSQKPRRVSSSSNSSSRSSSRSRESDWGPMQLDFQAMETLQHLRSPSPEATQEQPPAPPIEPPPSEMQEISRPFLALQIPMALSRSNSIADTPVSALSIPSPGGFFASLKASARHTWSIPPRLKESVPNTSTAEQFYGLPWDPPGKQVSTRNSTLAGSTLDGNDSQVTRRPNHVAPDDELEVKEINPSKTIFQYNESYHAELQKLATANLERTSDWLEEQDELMAALREMSDMGSPSSSQGSHSRGNSIDQIVRKKSVKFADDVKKAPDKNAEKKIDTYIQGFIYLREHSQKCDAYIHRQTRAEAMHVRRRCMPQAHRDHLLGRFVLTDPVRPAPPRPVSEFYMNDPTVLKERIARAQSERQALDQMLPGTWVLQALKKLNGGRLLSKPAARRVLRSVSPRILDVGGVPSNDWAWQVAYDYPHATVITVYTAGHNLSPDIKGPDNHKNTTVPNWWTFPFPKGHFDVISARTLYELLKTDKPLGRTRDEYDLCIRECFRCLKPGGIIDFSLIDSDIIHAGRQAQAMGVEFGFNLKTRGYDAAPTKSFLPRLRKAGFREVNRAWMILPMGKTAANWKDVLPVGVEPVQERTITPDGEVQVNDAPIYGTTVDAAMMTGIVGSWLYERWMLKLHREMGKDEDKLLEGVVQVLEEGAEQGSAWRYLTGYARKAKL